VTAEPLETSTRWLIEELARADAQADSSSSAISHCVTRPGAPAHEAGHEVA
jgi:hypothetical protein